MVIRVTIFSLLLGLSCYAQTSSKAGRERTSERRPSSEDVVKEDLRLPLRDGKWLAADLWLPSASGRFPTILFMTPYSRKNVGAPVPDENLELELPKRDNYALLLVDWRGFFGSKAARTIPDRGFPQLGKDGHDVVEWIAEQPWSDGKVAMWGASGPGRVQYSVAAEQPPHLTAIAPLVAADGFHYEDFYYGGVLKKAFVDMLGTVGFGAQQRARAAPAVENEFWDRIEETTASANRIDVPVMMLTGWYDLSVDSILKTFDALRREGGPATRRSIKLWIGPWHHVALGKRQQGELQFPEADGLSAAVSTRFFDYHLRGVDNGWDRYPPVTYIRMGHNQWFTLDSVPPRTGGTSRFYLGSEGRLSSRAPEEERARAGYEYDPADPSPTVGGMNAFIGVDPNYKKVGAGPRDQRPVEKRSDCLVFTSPVLESDVILEGKGRLKLFVSSNRSDTDFAARLTEVYPDGRSMLVTDGIQRMRYRGGEREELIKPGEIYPVEVELAITAHTFRKGHRVRLIVSSANYPRFDANPNIDRPRLLGRKTLTATNEVYFDRDHPSELALPRWAGVEPVPAGFIESLLR